MAVTQMRAAPSVRDTVTEAEWEARVALAAAYRLVAVYGMTDMIANHISSCVPGEEGRFLINPYGLLYTEITASSLVKVDLDGNVVGRGNTDLDINRAGYVIHSAIHAARHDVGCVVHTHTPAGMAVSALECGLLPITQTATRWSRIAYHSFEGIAINLDGAREPGARPRRRGGHDPAQPRPARPSAPPSRRRSTASIGWSSPARRS